MVKRLKQWLGSIEADKWLHMLCGLGIAQVAFALLSLALPWWDAALLALLVAVVAGGMKECIDMRCGVASWKDFAFTVVGGMIGVLLLIPVVL